MDLLQALVLGIVQGATEFLPISSSGHLVLLPWVLGWPAPGLAFGSLVHWGTLVAVVGYFWHDLLAIAAAWLRELPAVLWRRAWPSAPAARLGWWLLLGTVPAALVGVLFEAFFESLFSEPLAASSFLLVTAAILALGERVTSQTRPISSVGYRDAILVGVAQAMAILPGISRSGATIAAGLLRGLDRESAARFSFLLSIPIIFGAGLLPLQDAMAEGVGPDAPAFIVGFISSATIGYLAIRFLMNYLRRRSLYVFAIYCVVIGSSTLFANLLT